MTTSPSDIPEAAVIAASKALMADKMSNHSGDNAPQIMDACEAVARKILQAAAPHMLAPVAELADELVLSALTGSAYQTGRGSGFRIAGTRIRQVLGLAK